MTRIFFALLSSVLLLTGCQNLPQSVCEPHNESVMLGKIPGTDWSGCNGECKWVPEQGTGKVKCVTSTTDKCEDPCNCQVFSRPMKNWNGDWEHEGDWSNGQERNKEKHYRCWCVQPAK